MNQTTKLGLAAIAIIVIVLGGMFLTKNSNSTNTQNVVPTTSQQVTKEPATQPESTYKDGEYTAEGSYVSSAGPEQVEVSVTIKDGVIADSTFTGKATNSNSVRYQGLFAANFKPLVVGKNINEVKLDKVSGSSLAPKGFNDAIEKIKQQAQG